MTSNLMGLSETQERKLWRELKNDNQHAISWFKLLETFTELPDNRQQIALKKISLDAYTTLLHNLSAIEPDRAEELDAVRKHKENIQEVKDLMESLGISTDDIIGKPKPKQFVEDEPQKPKYGKDRSKYSPENQCGTITIAEMEIYKCLNEQKDANNKCRFSMSDLKDIASPNSTVTQVSSRCQALKDKGFITKTSKGRSSIIEVHPLASYVQQTRGTLK